MDSILSYIIIGLAIGGAVILFLEDLERGDLRLLKNAKKAAFLNQLDLLEKLHASIPPQDAVREQSRSWILEFLKQRQVVTIKSLEPLVQKIQAHFKTALAVDAIFTTDFPVRQDTTLTLVEAYHVLVIIDAALHNAAVHAKARYVFVISSLQDGELAVIVHDNGVGFEEAVVTPKTGMHAITNAVQHLGATLKRSSTLGNGTVVNLRIGKPASAVFKV